MESLSNIYFCEEPVHFLSPIQSYQGGNPNETTLSWKDNICCEASQAFRAHILNHKVVRNAERGNSALLLRLNCDADLLTIPIVHSECFSLFRIVVIFKVACT